jgi:hypothetical protein
MGTNKVLPAPERFAHFLQALQPLLNKAAQQKNPAIWLYRNNARTPLFMLQGLARLYANLHNPKRFGKLKEHFKLLEDGLGGIDHYEALVAQLSANKKMPSAILQYLKAQAKAKTEAMNELLIDKKWLGADNARMKKITDKLADADWMEPIAEAKAIEQEYRKEIAEIAQFVMDTNFHFNNMEEDVHELRRKLRWLSIYAQALRGAVQLDDKKAATKQQAKYLTKSVIDSPFNVLPPAPEGLPILYLDKHCFLALSWMVAELGNLKDQGLRIMALKEALQHTAQLDEAAAYKKAHQLSGNRTPGLLPLLDTAETITKQFFKEKNLSNLIKGVSQPA